MYKVPQLAVQAKLNKKQKEIDSGSQNEEDASGHWVQWWGINDRGKESLQVQHYMLCPRIQTSIHRPQWVWSVQDQNLAQCLNCGETQWEGQERPQGNSKNGLDRKRGKEDSLGETTLW